jgi:anaerobic selenocysteine-containing dehydrogenase
LPEFNGELPAATALDELETPGKGQVRALLTMAANPVLTAADGRRLASAFSQLEFFAAVDLFVNETTRHAHVLLPALTPLECDRYPLLEPAMAVRNGARFAPALLPRPAGVLGDWEILVELARRIGRRRGGRWLLADPAARVAGAVKPSRMLDVLLRLGPHRLSLDRLRRAPHGIDLGPLRPSLAERLRRTGRKVELVPADFVEDLPALQRGLEGGADADVLRLVTRRTLGAMNSWLHNSPRLARGARCTLQMHPEDAAHRGLAAGEEVCVSTEVGAIEVLLELTDEMMPGVVSLPFGWGHDRPGARLRVAARHPGASYNDLVSDRAVDRVSGTAALNGVRVTVTRV